MKHAILIEFHSSKLPADFLDKVAGRIYIMDDVSKSECTAKYVSSDMVGLMRVIEMADDLPATLKRQAA